MIFLIHLTQEVLTMAISKKPINDLILRKERKEASKESMADVSANFVKLGNSNIKLKVFNKGNALAQNVNIIIPDGNQIIPEHEIKEKLPIKLEQHQCVELLAITHMNIPRKIKCLISWEDIHSIENKKEVELTL